MWPAIAGLILLKNLLRCSLWYDLLRDDDLCLGSGCHGAIAQFRECLALRLLSFLAEFGCKILCFRRITQALTRTSWRRLIVLRSRLENSRRYALV